MAPVLALLRRPLLHVAGLSMVLNLLLLAPAIFMLQVFDRVLVSHSGATLAVLMVGVGVALALTFALDGVRARLQGVAGSLAAEALTPAVTRIAIAQGAKGAGRGPGDGLRDVASLRALFSANGLLAMFDAPWVVVYVGVIWLAHPVLGIAAACAAVVLLGLACINDALTRRDIDAVQREATGASRYLDASLHNAELALALGMGNALIARWRAMQAQVTALQAPLAQRSVALAALTRALRQTVQVVMLSIGAWLVISGEATSGVMIATTVLLGRALAPVEQVVGSWKVLAEGRAAWRRLSALLVAEAVPHRMSLPPPRGVLHAQQLVFRAPGSDRLIVGGVSLQLDAGESLAIVGPSGAGKSTLVRLLTGVWQPSAGTVRLDQADLGQWPREEIGPWIGYVPQDVALFPGTVAENIARLGDVDWQRVVQAAQRARVHDLILSLPEGYDTPVVPGGGGLSPGQRQRIALARALYGDPRLLVLDEPNANLDGEGELALAQTLQSLRGEVTVVVVTHRSGLTQHADQMLVLDGGKAVHYGATADVLKALQQKGQSAQVVTLPRAAQAGRSS
jgi:PrtD family type I secretion system ABC transporter